MMRAQTITTMNRRRRRARRSSALALALGACALAIPASAGAAPIDGGYSSVNAITNEDAAAVPGFGTAIHAAIADPRNQRFYYQAEPGGSDQSFHADPTTVNATLGADGVVEPTLITGSPASADDGFDWASGAVGAGAALAFAALGAAALLTARRRTAASPAA
jgi:hypothetical protein